jgi:hypothetical protein
MQERSQLPEMMFAHHADHFRRAAIYEGNYSDDIRNLRMALIFNCIAHNDSEIFPKQLNPKPLKLFPTDD